MPKIRIPPGKTYSTLVVGNVYALKPEKILAKTGCSICMKVMWTARSAGMKPRPPQVVFFVKGVNYCKTPIHKLSILKSYGEIKIHTVKVFPTRVIRNILYADKDNDEKIFLGVGLFSDQSEGKEFIAFYVRGDYHVETPSYYRRKPEEWKTWCEFHMPFDFLEDLKNILISSIKNQRFVSPKQLEDLILCIEFPAEKIEYLISRIDKAIEDGVIMPAVSYLIPMKDTRVLETTLSDFDISIESPIRNCENMLEELPTRTARYETPEERQMAYFLEKKERHGIAQTFEEPVMKDILSRIIKVVNKLTIDYIPFGIDKIQDKSMIIDEAERGRPDFKLILQLDGRKWTKYVEIKIKAQPHIKTKAWYFDQYVFDQLMAFCNKYKVSPKDVIIVFAHNQNLHEDYKNRKFIPEHWNYCIISLKEIQEGVNNKKYTIYGEGYGAPL